MKPFVAPPLPEPFPEPFLRLLHELLARGATPRAQRDDRRRARRAVLAQTGTFVGHRRYARGDDPRRIDWSALARSGELFVKQHADDDRRTVTLLLELAPRMAVGEPPRRLAALRLAAVLGGLALRSVDGVQVLAPGAGAAAVASFAGAGDLGALLTHLRGLPTAIATPRETLALCEPRLATGAVHWIADFADPEAAGAILRALRRRGVPVHGWLPSLPLDGELPARGYVEVADPDTGRSVPIPVDGALLAAVRHELAQLRLRQDRLFAQVGGRLTRWPSPPRDDWRAGAYEAILAEVAP
jgi:uncharacterized protein (DUF58 family)